VDRVDERHVEFVDEYRGDGISKEGVEETRKMGNIAGRSTGFIPSCNNDIAMVKNQRHKLLKL